MWNHLLALLMLLLETSLQTADPVTMELWPFCWKPSWCLWGFFFFSSLRRGDLNCNYPSDHQQPEHSGMDVGPCSRQESDVRRLHKVVDKDRVETGSRVATLAVAFSHLKAESEQDQCRPDGPTAQLT